MAKLYITECSNIGTASGAQVLKMPPVATQVVDFSGGVQPSAAFNRSTWVIRIHADAICSVRFDGSASTTSHMRMVAGQTECFQVQPGDKLSVISNT